MKHRLRRCVYCELQFSNFLYSPYADFDNIEEICEQLYMDALEHGFNWWRVGIIRLAVGTVR